MKKHVIDDEMYNKLHYNYSSELKCSPFPLHFLFSNIIVRMLLKFTREVSTISKTFFNDCVLGLPFE